jgi:hypothetical protein
MLVSMSLCGGNITFFILAMGMIVNKEGEAERENLEHSGIPRLPVIVISDS